MTDPLTVAYGRALLARHLGEMSAMSRKKWPKIIERDGFQIISDLPYQGFDNDPSCPHYRFCGHFPEWYPDPRFWCRAITVERLSDGRRATACGPQRQAYEDACAIVEATDD